MNPRTRRAALYAIGVIAILASANALGHSYAGLYDWAAHHDLSGWQAMSWPAEIDVFLAIGELALYVAYLDGWPGRQRIWPWATALTGLSVSVAGNIGHIQPAPGHPVLLADRLTAATSPLAAFAGLAIGLLVLKMTRQQPDARTEHPSFSTGPARQPSPAESGSPTAGQRQPARIAEIRGITPARSLLDDAVVICQTAAADSGQLSQRALARQLRDRGHRFSNQQLHTIAATVGLITEEAA